MMDDQLVKGLQKRSEEAFEECYYKYKDLVYYVIIKMTRNKEMTEDLVQDTFIRMYQQIDELKKQKVEVEFADYLVADVIDTSVEMRNLMFEMEKILSPREYEIIILKTVYNMKQKEIAEYLGIPIGTVGWVYQEGIKKFKKAYRKEK